MVQEHWQAFLDAVDAIPDDRLTEPGVTGEWSVKDLLGHVAFWDGWSIAYLMKLAYDMPLKVEKYDYLAVNDRESAARANWSLADQRRDLELSHDAVVAVLRMALQKGAEITPEAIADQITDHYDEHAAELRAFRERLGR